MKMKMIFRILVRPIGTLYTIHGRKVNRFQYLRSALRGFKETQKPVILRAKFGKGRKSRIKEWRFKTRNGAERFGKVFLRYNPRCTTYMIFGD